MTAPITQRSKASVPANLRAPGAVLLISCYELGHPPHGLSMAAAFLERAGYQPAMLDVSTEPLDPSAVAAARCAAISVPMHTALRLGIAVARQVRDANPACTILFYGLYAPLHAAVLQEGLADGILGGEYEADLVAALDAIGAGKPPPSSRVTLAKLDFPVPSRKALPPLSRYARLDLGGSERLAGYVETSRGCLHTCRHCPIPAVYDGRFFVVPPAVVLADIANLVEAGARHITFGDPDFLNGPGHALRIVRGMHAGFPDLSFDFTAKVEHLLAHRFLLEEFAASGAAFVVSAVESLSNTVLERLHKGHDRADVDTVLAALREAGIALRPSLLPFTPWSTLEDFFDLLAWVETHDLVDSVDPVQWTIRLLVPPGSLLLDDAALRPLLGPLDPLALTYTWRHPDPKLDLLQQLVARSVESAAAAGEPSEVTFRRIQAAARAVRDDTTGDAAAIAAAADRDFASSPTPVRPQRGQVPRLTESWFCCAEPTALQLSALRSTPRSDGAPATNAMPCCE